MDILPLARPGAKTTPAEPSDGVLRGYDRKGCGSDEIRPHTCLEEDADRLWALIEKKVPAERRTVLRK